MKTGLVRFKLETIPIGYRANKMLTEKMGSHHIP